MKNKKDKEKDISNNFSLLAKWRRKTEKRMRKIGVEICRLDRRIKRWKENEFSLLIFFLMIDGLDDLKAERKYLRDELSFCKKNLRDYKRAVYLLKAKRLPDFNCHINRMTERINADIDELKKQRKPLTIKERINRLLDNDATLNYAVASTTRR